MKNILYFLFVLGMGVLASWFMFDGMARQQEVRETGVKNGMVHCSKAGTGQHCWLEATAGSHGRIGKYKEALIITSGRKR